MPFPPLSLHQRISSPGRDLFGKKKASAVPPPPPPPPPAAPQPDLTTTSSSKPGEEKTSSSWASANLRNLGRKPQQDSKARSSSQKQDEPPPHPPHHQHHQGKCSWLSVPSKPQEPRTTSSSSPSSSPMDPATKHQEAKKKELQFTLSLTPEAILVIQKRNLEKQMMAKQQKCCAGGDFRHRRVFPSKKAHGAAKSCGSGAPKPDPLEQDITAIVKISLLNDQYKYDDVEYEDEDGDVDETVVRKCKEWLKGVENAAALGKVDNKLSALPHLKGC